MVIPPVMVFLSVTLKDRANRWASIKTEILMVIPDYTEAELEKEAEVFWKKEESCHHA